MRTYQRGAGSLRIGSRGAWAIAALIGLVATSACSTGSGSSFGGTTGSAGAPAPSGANVVAMLETGVPSKTTFTLRGTIPVPPGSATGIANGIIPFSVVDVDGTLAPTQVEVVSRYPKASDGPDVVEILARVQAPAGAAVGSKTSYEVIVNPHTKGRAKFDAAQITLMMQPGAMMLVSHDAFGNSYGMDLAQGVRALYAKGQADVRKDGEVAVQIRKHDSMMPADPSQVGQWGGPLEHWFGVHAYHTIWSGEKSISLDLRVHNGHSGLDKSDPVDDPLGKAYYRDLELWVPQGYTVQQQHPDPGFGPPYDYKTWTVYPLVKPIPSGEMHLMPSQAQFHRRLVVSKTSSQSEGLSIVQEEGRAFAKRGPSPTGGELWSWWNPQTARYFPARIRLPELDYLGQSTSASKVSKDYNTIKNLLKGGGKGNFPVANFKMGHAHPWGAAYGGVTGGSEIYLYDGLLTAELGSIQGFKLAQATHRMYSDRMPDTLFNKDGNPTCLSDWTKQGGNGPYFPALFFQKLIGGSDPFGFSQASQAHVNHVKNKGLKPSYEATFDNFSPIDFQHLARYTRSAKVLAWLGNDQIARDDLRMQGEVFRMSYTFLPNSSTGSAIVSGALNDLNSVNANPGEGFAFGRGEGWGLDCMNAVYSLEDDAWRQASQPWFTQITDMVSAGQSSCNGFIQSIISSKILAGTYRVRQSIEQSICENALRGTLESVFRGVDPARQSELEYTLERSLYAMIGPMAWSTTFKGPHSYLAVGPKGIAATSPFCGSVPGDGFGNGPDKFQIWSSFAYGYELTGDTTFIQRAKEAMGIGGGAMKLTQKFVKEGFSNLENRAALISLAQEQGF